MTKKLFQKHNVVNVYFEGKEATYKDKIKERDKFKEYLFETIKKSFNPEIGFGNYYNFPYDHNIHNTNSVYLKIGVKYLWTRNQFMKILKSYEVKNKNIKLRFQEFKFKNSHYTIEILKFTGYACGTIMYNNTISKKKFRNNILRKFNKINGDRLSKGQKKRLTCEEWLNLMHHMFLSLDINYQEEALIYGLGNKRIQYNINRSR